MSARRSWRGRVFIASSLDGFIARSDSSLDWLVDPPSDIEHARVQSDRPALTWQTFLPSVDHLVMGRGTYEKALSFDHWPYSQQQVIVLSTSLAPETDERIVISRSVSEASGLLCQRKARQVYIDGGQTIQAFLRAGLIDEMTISVAPVLLGGGIRLFGDLSDEIRLRLRAANASAGGMTHATYDIVQSTK
jgi:dihydrofolate reductase